MTFIALERIPALNGKMEIETVYAIHTATLPFCEGRLSWSTRDAAGTLHKMVTESIEVAIRGGDGIWRFKVDHPYGALPRTKERSLEA